MQERERAPSTEPRFFSDTLSEERAPLRHGVSAPLGLAAHGFGIAAMLALSLLSVPDYPSRRSSTTFLQFAPPPPPTLVRGTAPESSPARVVEADVVTFDPTPTFTIPDEMLAAIIPIGDVSIGFENGFDDGEANGMAGGMPNGVVGGVPGGLVGGIIGGTGNELPELPKPDVGPRPIRMPPPIYTEEAARENVRGSVKLRVIITAQGTVDVLEVLESIPALDAEAIRAVESTWRFHPATKNGRPIACLSNLVVRFNLY